MDIKHVFEDSRIVMLEEDIARINEYCKYSDRYYFIKLNSTNYGTLENFS